MINRRKFIIGLAAAAALGASGCAITPTQSPPTPLRPGARISTPWQYNEYIKNGGEW